MKLAGIELKQPTFLSFTSAVVAAILIFLVLSVSPWAPSSPLMAVYFFLSIMLGSVSYSFGLDITKSINGLAVLVLGNVFLGVIFWFFAVLFID